MIFDGGSLDRGINRSSRVFTNTWPDPNISWAWLLWPELRSDPQRIGPENPNGLDEGNENELNLFFSRRHGQCTCKTKELPVDWILLVQKEGEN